MSQTPLIDVVPALDLGDVQKLLRSTALDHDTFVAQTAAQRLRSPDAVAAVKRVGQVGDCVPALLSGRSLLITGSDGIAAILCAMCPDLIAAGNRVLRVRPPLDLPAFLFQVAQQGPSSGTAQDAPDHEEDVLERGFDSLTVPDQADGGIVLLVEDAHRLPPATLNYVQFAIQTEPQLVLVLAGRSEITDILATPAYALLRARLSLHLLAPPPPVSNPAPRDAPARMAVRINRGMVLVIAAVIAVVAGATAVRTIATRPVAVPVLANIPFAPTIHLGPRPDATTTGPQMPALPESATTEAQPPATMPDPRRAGDVDPPPPAASATVDAGAQTPPQPMASAPSGPVPPQDEPAPSIRRPQEAEAQQDVQPGPAPAVRPEADIQPAPAPLAAAIDPAPVPSPGPTLAIPPAMPRVELPKAVPARVLLRYGRNSAVGLARAADLAKILRQNGVQVADPVTASAPIAAASVEFFYADDRPNAERIAREITGGTPLQRRLPTNGALPAPGTIEILVAGS